MYRMYRKTVYDTYKQYKRSPDTRTMDEICKHNANFELQVQQKFLKEYTVNTPDWKSLLLYHELGSGKTCTAISIAEEQMRIDDKFKTLVLLPARLKTNFLDELMTDCVSDKYLSKSDLKLLMDPKVSKKIKTEARLRFEDKVKERYTIMSFDRLKINAKKTRNLYKWCQDLTRDRILIIDEVHNLVNNTYAESDFDLLTRQNAIGSKITGLNTILFRYITKNAHPTCKMLFLTATPIFDNINQIKELAAGLNPSFVLRKGATLEEAINAMKGKVSYFPGTSKAAYPEVEFVYHDVPLTSIQDTITHQIDEANQKGGDGNSSGEYVLIPDEDDLNEAFLAKQRQIAIACLPGNKKNIDRVASNVNKYAPKIATLVSELKKYPGKHVVFSNFIYQGLRIVQKVLDRNEYFDFRSVKDMITTRQYPFYKVYALWDGSVSDREKQHLKNILNSVDNIDGRLIKIVLGSPSIKEGVSFKHVQHMHLLDPVWNLSAKSQVEGRVVRFCSHVDIDRTKYPDLDRKVVIHTYVSVPREDGLVNVTCDEIIYYRIIPKKAAFVRNGEEYLKKIAIDYYLFRRLYRITPLSSPQNDESPIHIIPEKLKHNEKKEKKKNTCPSRRRPDKETNKCGEGYEPMMNNNGNPCCYKIKKQKRTSTCPSKRRPNQNNKCPEGQFLGKNKAGDPCCYKRKQS